jgi:predicted lipase
MDSIFRQSQLKINVADFDSPAHAYRLVHAGFQHGYMQLRSDVYAQVGTLVGMYPGAQITYIGHSLGD